MARAKLTIDLNAIAGNWRRLDALTVDRTVTAAVVKADCYGLGASRVAPLLHRECGVESFFVALAEEGADLRRILGNGAEILVLSGYYRRDAGLIADFDLTPVLNSAAQFAGFRRDFPQAPLALQIDTGMNRLGMEASEFCSAREALGSTAPVLVMSHLACADDPSDPLNARQLAEFRQMTEGMNTRLSLAATGGMLLGPDYHFDICRPGIGLYGGLPHAAASPAVQLEIPVIQVREVNPGEVVGYGGEWRADTPSRIATISAGYADGIFRSLADRLTFFADGTPCKAVGRVSMDLITVDVGGLATVPESMQLLGAGQTIDDLAACASTIGYEILTSLGGRYERVYTGG